MNTPHERTTTATDQQPLRVAVLDDYQGVALASADWTPLGGRVQVDSFSDHVSDTDALVARLADYDVVVVMRERTPLPAEVIAALPRLRLIVTTGRRNSVIDVAAAAQRGIAVCGTGSLATAPSELTWALILAHFRHLVDEAQAMRTGGWQTTVGRDLAGHTLGVIGLGRIGTQVARVGSAFGMHVIAWSPHLTDERATAAGASRVSLDRLLELSDVVTLHVPLNQGTTQLLNGARIAQMKPSALLVNTSRGAVVDEAALLTALRSGQLGGVALDVFDEEPLSTDHPLRSTPGALLTPHLGFVTEDVYRLFFTEVVEDIAAFLRGELLRQLS